VSLDDIKAIANTLKPYFNEKNIFIISSDFSHYPSYNDAIVVDNETAKAIISGNPDNLVAHINKYKDYKVNNLSTTCCGWSSILTLMYLVDTNKYEYKLIEYKNSGDSNYGDKENVVGYCAISVGLKKNDEFYLTDNEKIELLKIARRTIEEKIINNSKPNIKDFNITSNMSKPCGAFVTLHKDGALRGCIGQFEPDKPLYEVVIDMAISSALYDYRFSPLTKDEIDKVDIEISVLTPLRKINSIQEIELGKHGIYIKKGGRGGTFLPQVAKETGWTLEEFLGHCARDKAGIGWDGWKDADIYVYEAIVFSEKDYGLFPKKKTKYYTKLDNNKVRCELCPNYCILSEGQVGPCRARKNVNGELQSLTYGKIVALRNDPVEKKPLYHFLPGTYTISIGTAGCNLHCKNCQNYTISQVSPDDIDYELITPEQLVALAKKYNSKSISYTYNEPTIFYEFMLETAKLAHKEGIKNILVSNGYINKEPLRELIPYLDAANIDLKCFDDKIYRELTGGSLEPVLETILLLKENNIWVEITNLVIPGYTDDMKMISKMCDWIVKNKLQDVPLHFSRFFPAYKLTNVPPTPLETLKQAAEIAKSKGIKYVYIGNISEESITYCPVCGEKLIIRRGYNVNNTSFNGICPKCKSKIPGIWNN
jgi:pyruvate formate lyase activating enzyme